jgi:hypothetical protein
MVSLKTNEARQGSTPHVTRYVLGWGLALGLVALFGAWWLFAS